MRSLASAWGAVGGAGAAVGVLLGGVLTELVDWRLIFLINLPVGLALAAGALRIVPADRVRPHGRGFDLRGALVATPSLGALVYAASQADDAGWASTQTLGLGLAALAGLAVFAALELRTPMPLLRVQRLRDRGVGGGFLMMLAVSAMLFGTFLGAGAALASGVGDAFLAAATLAGVASVLALAILPSATSFLPKLRLAPPVAVH